MSKPEDFLIEDGILKKYLGTDKIIVVPDGVQRIIYSFFKGMTADDFDSLFVPDSVEDFSIRSFDLNDKIKDGIVKKFTDEDGFLIFGNHLLLYSGNDETVTIPPHIRQIAYEAFKQSHCVKKVIVNEGLEKILDSSLCCSNLETVVLPSSVRYIAENAFNGCDKLTSINIPSNALVEPEAFLGCSGLTDERGLLVINGKLVAFDKKKNHQYFTPDSDKFILTIPEDVKEVCNINHNLNYALGSIDVVEVTDCIESIDSGAFAFISAILSFRIIDHVSKEMLYESSFGEEYGYEGVDVDDDFWDFCENITDYTKKK